MAIPFLVSIRFLCRACLSRLLGEFVWGAAHSFRLFVFFFVREILYELGCWSDVTVCKCNNALRHAIRWDAMGLTYFCRTASRDLYGCREDA